MTDRIDNWYKLARYDTNIQGELHANLLRNNGISVSLQPLSAMPGMNSGMVLWIQDIDVAHARRILANIDTDAATADEGADAGSTPRPHPILPPITDNHGGNH